MSISTSCDIPLENSTREIRTDKSSRVTSTAAAAAAATLRAVGSAFPWRTSAAVKCWFGDFTVNVARGFSAFAGETDNRTVVQIHSGPSQDDVALSTLLNESNVSAGTPNTAARTNALAAAPTGRYTRNKQAVEGRVIQFTTSILAPTAW
jgi:hypothetical protein